MKLLMTLFCFLLFSIFSFGQDPVYALVWSDEFEGNGIINGDKWFHQTLLPNGDSWYNGEIQHYTNRQENSFVSDGTLKIVAKKGFFIDQGVIKEYTSARLNSKFAFTYGKVEVRAKLPSGIGTWPAIWTLGQNITEPGGYWTNEFGDTPWPACGEIDIMEHWGDNQDFIQSAIHSPSSFGNTINKGGQFIPNASNDFHLYTMEWTENKISFSVDDVLHYTYQPETQTPATWPFDENQYILLNVAILPNITSDFIESNMEIDYVRVYQEEILSITSKDLEAITIYPNPSEEFLKVNVPPNFIGSEINIYSLLGQKLLYKKIDIENISINLSSLDKGTYLFHLQGEFDAVSRLFVKR